MTFVAMLLGDKVLRNPITGIVGCCCARTASGHISTAAPKISVMKSRRLIAQKASKTFNSSFLRALDSRRSARFSDGRQFARKNNSNFGVLAGLRIDLYRSRMLL